MNPAALDPQLLTFLAGAGIGPLLDQISKLMKGHGGAQRNPGAPSAGLPHRPGMRLEASQAGGTTIAPSMLQALMQRGGQAPQMPQVPQPPQGAPNPQQLLQLLAQRGAG